MSRRNSKETSFLILILVFSILASNVMAAVNDEDPLLQTSDLERELSVRFGLKPTEMNALRPLIRLDNRNAVLMYVNAADDHEADYLFLWDKVRRAHTEFEASISPKMSRRDKQVLSAAHVEFESRILMLWSDDYTSLLTQVLELDSVQQGMVRMVFEAERLHRHALILRTGISDELFNADWDGFTRRREGELRKLLRKEQVRAYRSLVDPPTPLIAIYAGSTVQRSGD